MLHSSWTARGTHYENIYSSCGPFGLVYFSWTTLEGLQWCFFWFRSFCWIAQYLSDLHSSCNLAWHAVKSRYALLFCTFWLIAVIQSSLFALGLWWDLLISWKLQNFIFSSLQFPNSATNKEHTKLFWLCFRHVKLRKIEYVCMSLHQWILSSIFQLQWHSTMSIFVRHGIFSANYRFMGFWCDSITYLCQKPQRKEFELLLLIVSAQEETHHVRFVLQTPTSHTMTQSRLSVWLWQKTLTFDYFRYLQYTRRSIR